MSALLDARISKSFEALSPILSKKDPEILRDMVKQLGITDDDVGMKILDEMTTFEDFKRVLVSPGVLLTSAEPRMKVAFAYLQGIDPFAREKPTAPGSLAEAYLMNRPIGQWSDEELIKKYGKECPADIENELASRTKNRPCIIFNDDGAVNVEVSLKLVRMARRQDTPKTFAVNGEVRIVYATGEFPLDIFYECPVHSSVLLVDGYCEECGTVWDDPAGNRNKNAFIRLIPKQGLDPARIQELAVKSLPELAKLYPKIWRQYQELKEEDNLPSLKRHISKTKSGDPFNAVHRAY